MAEADRFHTSKHRTPKLRFMNRRRVPWSVASVAAIVSIVAVAACDTDDGRQMKEPTSPLPSAVPVEVDEPIETIVPAEPTTPPVDLALVAPWPNGEAIPTLYTCDGDDVSPALRWSTGSAETTEFAISMVDPGANNYVHWIVTGIDPATSSLEEGRLPPGVVVGANSSGDEGYTGPCPPDPEPHDYVVTVYALSQPLGLTGTESPNEMLDLLMATNLASSAVWGSYTRSS